MQEPTSHESAPRVTADEVGRVNCNAQAARLFGESAEINGWLYCFQAMGTELVKVGWTSNPARRWQQLSVACPYRLVMVAMVGAEKPAETLFHAAFHQCRVRGEWFDDAEHRVRTGIVSLTLDHNGCSSPMAKRALERIAA